MRIVFCSILLSMFLFSCKKVVNDIVDCALAPYGARFDYHVVNPENFPQYVQFKYINIDSTRKLSFHWDFGNGMEGDEENPLELYEESGIYKVRLSVTGTVGGEPCTKSEEMDIELK
ncbi:PKD domain-containing protein [Aureibacter tunicatorum]|uniref:PKD domain-containing protein n=1 Tax=Aureibacter tunicatorum TaxID=866807 RepID=A0AAE4BUH3_9BACT|nr:PKD domain-containing protein [Aureibacter tunicatorum]MDR6241060.1 hypothetical protein [Aureibacter tunicatorum]BDD03838.1 hypothetical protein AUTU_13210 [Aureibacter tunicatorum]